MFPLVNLYRSATAGVLELLWPQACLLCSADAAGDGFCDSCKKELLKPDGSTCPRCSSTVGPHALIDDGCPRCSKFRYAFRGTNRCGAYDGLLREAVLRMKDETGEVLAYRLGMLWGADRREQLLSAKPQVLIPIPLHRSKRFSRGYDQAAELTRGLSRSLGVPMLGRVLVRKRGTAPQAEQTATGRWDNVRDLFSVRNAAAVKGVRIMLIDDVLTTGATCDAASRALLAAGAAQVDVAVIAHR